MMDKAAFLAALFGPFVQEDAAVLSVAAAAVAMPHNTAALLSTLWLGLTLSDVWKYWVGRLAHAHPWARRMADKPAVLKLGDTVTQRIGIAMMVARFVPGTRIPLYLAAGWYRVAFLRFFLWMVASAGLYVLLAWLALRALGAVAGPMVVAQAGWAVAGLVVLALTIAMLAGLWRKRRLKV